MNRYLTTAELSRECGITHQAIAKNKLLPFTISESGKRLYDSEHVDIKELIKKHKPKFKKTQMTKIITKEEKRQKKKAENNIHKLKCRKLEAEIAKIHLATEREGFDLDEKRKNVIDHGIVRYYYIGYLDRLNRSLLSMTKKLFKKIESIIIAGNKKEEASEITAKKIIDLIKDEIEITLKKTKDAQAEEIESWENKKK